VAALFLGGAGCATDPRYGPNNRNSPLASSRTPSLHFASGEFEGLKLIGFSVWERRKGGGRNETCPGEAIRPVNGSAAASPFCVRSAKRRLKTSVSNADSNEMDDVPQGVPGTNTCSLEVEVLRISSHEVHDAINCNGFCRLRRLLYRANTGLENIREQFGAHRSAPANADVRICTVKLEAPPGFEPGIEVLQI
jgi:hypothetical protein